MYRFTADQSILDQIATNISDAFEVDYTPVTAFIATWDSVPQFTGSINEVRTASSVNGYL